MKTPAGGHRSTQWVIQHRRPATPEAAVTPWERYPADPSFTATGQSTRAVLVSLRENVSEQEWRAVRVETVQRVEDW